MRVNAAKVPGRYADGNGLLLRKAADRGDPGAEYNLAVALDNGEFGLAPDRARAVLLFRRAAQQNVVLAQRELALHLRAGDGVAPDPVQATFWFKKAADAGDTFSQAQLNQDGSSFGL